MSVSHRNGDLYHDPLRDNAQLQKLFIKHLFKCSCQLSSFMKNLYKRWASLWALFCEMQIFVIVLFINNISPALSQ